MYVHMYTHAWLFSIRMYTHIFACASICINLHCISFQYCHSYTPNVTYVHNIILYTRCIHSYIRMYSYIILCLFHCVYLSDVEQLKDLREKVYVHTSHSIFNGSGHRLGGVVCSSRLLPSSPHPSNPSAIQPKPPYITTSELPGL